MRSAREKFVPGGSQGLHELGVRHRIRRGQIHWSGKIRALAVTTLKRSALMPDLPTIAEAGLPGFEANNWNAFFVPSGTPRPLVNRLNKDLTAALSLPEIKEFMFNQGLDAARGRTPRPRIFCSVRDIIEQAYEVALSAQDVEEGLAGEAGELAPGSPPVATAVSPPVVRIGIAYDQAFCFYYAENLELLEDEGAELVRFSPIRDRVMPDCDLLYLGGGYPELHAAALSANATMRASIREFAARGGALYAECGGMMYLTEAIRDLDGRVHEMVGLFPAEAVMGKGRMTLGYREVEIATPCVLGTAGLKARGHEFHYSVLVPKGDLAYGCVLTDAGGERRGQDGLLYRNVVALYSHLHFGSQPLLARSLVAAARKGRVERTVSRESAP